jgi:hypothetical protein
MNGFEPVVWAGWRSSLPGRYAPARAAAPMGAMETGRTASPASDDGHDHDRRRDAVDTSGGREGFEKGRNYEG